MYRFALLIVAVTLLSGSVSQAASYEKRTGPIVDPILDTGGDVHPYSGSNLESGAYLSGADLSDANLNGASLTGADLFGANLSHANLIGADLKGADLTGANLANADLASATLTGANLHQALLPSAMLSLPVVNGAVVS